MGKPLVVIQAEIGEGQQRRPGRTVQTVETPSLGPILRIHPFMVPRDRPQLQQGAPRAAIQVFGPLQNPHRISIPRERHLELGRRTQSVVHRLHRVREEHGGAERKAGDECPTQGFKAKRIRFHGKWRVSGSKNSGSRN